MIIYKQEELLGNIEKGNRSDYLLGYGVICNVSETLLADNILISLPFNLSYRL